jgi:hypothetical protein
MVYNNVIEARTHESEQGNEQLRTEPERNRC